MRATRSAPLARALTRHLDRFPDLLPAGSIVLVAVSGGRDSVALLHVLRFGPGAGRWDLRAAHFDHRMRPGSDSDLAWVRGLARAWDVPFVWAAADIVPDSEADARAARYAFLEEVANRVGAARIVTAHHADDQAETVLFRLLRGTGLPGLAGIPARRGRIVRPLLAYGRARIEAYAESAGLRWREDPTNRELRFARNRLRHVVLPALERAAPGTRRALLHLGRRVREAERDLHPLLDEAERTAVRTEEGGAFVLARDTLLAYDPWVRARVLRRLLRRMGGTPGRPGLRAATDFVKRARSGAVLQLAGGVRLDREFDRFVLHRPGAAPDGTPLVLTQDGEGSGEAVVGGVPVQVTWGAAPRATGQTVALDPSRLRFPLTLRGWRPGDRIRLGYGTKKLKKLFAERRLARTARMRVPVLADATGRILWVAGVAEDAAAGPRPGHTPLYITVSA